MAIDEILRSIYERDIRTAMRPSSRSMRNVTWQRNNKSG